MNCGWRSLRSWNRSRSRMTRRHFSTSGGRHSLKIRIQLYHLSNFAESSASGGMREVRLLPAVIDDLSKGIRWYDEQASEELGDKFLSVFYSYLPRIGRSSEGYAVIYK